MTIEPENSFEIKHKAIITDTAKTRLTLRITVSIPY